MLNQEKLEQLLNRSLTTSETTNLKLYLDIATKKLEALLCFRLCDDGGNRSFSSRRGYSDLYIDPCSAVTAVTVDGVATTDYVLKQNDRYDGDWYNIIEFDDKMIGNKVVVTASWGFDSLPSDLALVLAKLFDLNTKAQTNDSRVQSKQVEDFRITYKDVTLDEQFYSDYGSTLSKYSQCNVGYILTGGCHDGIQ